MLSVGDDSADRHRVAEVAVGAQHAPGAVLDRDALLELLDGLLVMVAEDVHAHDSDGTPVLVKREPTGLAALGSKRKS